jgi:hypothetical protein
VPEAGGSSRVWCSSWKNGAKPVPAEICGAEVSSADVWEKPWRADHDDLFPVVAPERPRMLLVGPAELDDVARAARMQPAADVAALRVVANPQLKLAVGCEPGKRRERALDDDVRILDQHRPHGRSALGQMCGGGRELKRDEARARRGGRARHNARGREVREREREGGVRRRAARRVGLEEVEPAEEEAAEDGDGGEAARETSRLGRIGRGEARRAEESARAHTLAGEEKRHRRAGPDAPPHVMLQRGAPSAMSHGPPADVVACDARFSRVSWIKLNDKSIQQRENGIDNKVESRVTASIC